MPLALPSPFSSVIFFAPFGFASAPLLESCGTLWAHDRARRTGSHGVPARADFPSITVVLAQLPAIYKWLWRQANLRVLRQHIHGQADLRDRYLFGDADDRHGAAGERIGRSVDEDLAVPRPVNAHVATRR